MTRVAVDIETIPIKEDPTNDQPPKPENWGEIRKAVYRRDNYHCTNCASAGGPHGDTELHADHVLPRSRGGSAPSKIYVRSVDRAIRPDMLDCSGDTQ